MRREPLHPVVEDEEEERRAEQARIFSEKMKREAEERNRRMKELAQKRDEELKREEQEREAYEKRQQLELVKKRQNENILKLQEVRSGQLGEREARERAGGAEALHDEGSSPEKRQSHSAVRQDAGRPRDQKQAVV